MSNIYINGGGKIARVPQGRGPEIVKMVLNVEQHAIISDIDLFMIEV